MTALRLAALRLAGAGAYVFPCEPGGKRPACRNGFKDATRDPDTIRGWWTRRPDCNVGIDCGRSGLAVIDLDGPIGLACWTELLERHPDTAQTLRARTPSGGEHHYYRADRGRPLRSTAAQLAERVDTRGVGGYVVAPPSVRPDGTYTWLDTAELERLPVVPPWLLDALEPRPAVRQPLTQRPHGSIRGALAGLLDTVLTAPLGQRNARLHWAACRAGEHVAAGRLDRLAAVGALEAAGLDAGLGEHEVTATVRSGLGGAL